LLCLSGYNNREIFYRCQPPSAEGEVLGNVLPLSKGFSANATGFQEYLAVNLAGRPAGGYLGQAMVILEQ